MAALLSSGQALIDWAWIGRNADDILALLVEHVQITVASVGLGFVVAFPLALLAVRWQWIYPPLLGIAGLLFTIPSIALFVLMVGITGLGVTTVVIPLSIYTLLVLVRNTVEGFLGIDPNVREAAEAMGYRRARQILRVELPLALPVIIAGLRIAMVTAVGLATVGALVGSGGLGDLFTDAAARRFLTPAVVGIVLASTLAIILDLLLLGLQRALTPWRQGAA